jgi:hypothetical protein
MLVFYVFFYKIGEKEGGTGPVQRFGTSGKGKVVGKRGRKMNILQILCAHVCKYKNETS